jgi:spermidine/putrescine transport system permease protein
LAAPAWAWYLAMFAAPIIIMVVYSFGLKPPTGAKGLVTFKGAPTLANYRRALNTSGPLFAVFRQTLRVALLGTVLCLLIGFPVAYWIATKVSPRRRGIVLALVIVPFFTSYIVRTIAWRIVLSPKGWVSGFFQSIHLMSTPFDLLNTRTAVQIGVVYNYLPLMIFPLFVALDRIDPALREASKDLGAGRIKTMARVTLPLGMPGVVSGLLLVFIPLAGDYVTANLLGGAKGNMVGSLVASQLEGAQNLPLGCALAVVLILMILATIAAFAIVALLIRFVIRRFRGFDLASTEPVVVPRPAELRMEQA